MPHRVASFIDLSPQLGSLKLKQISGTTPPVVALANGDNDLYTVPTGRRAIGLFNTAFNTAVGALNLYSTFKRSGTVYRVSSTANINAGAQGNTAWQIVCEAGDILGANASGTGLNLSGTIFEFDVSSPLKTAIILDTSNGDQTLYTCPANKRAYLFNSAFTFGLGVISFCGTTGTPSITPYLVPSGGSKGATNQIAAATPASASTRSSINCSTVLAAGDTIVINGNGTGAIVFASIQELPA
jgi:hypothetical protein